MAKISARTGLGGRCVPRHHNCARKMEQHGRWSDLHLSEDPFLWLVDGRWFARRGIGGKGCFVFVRVAELADIDELARRRTLCGVLN